MTKNTSTSARIGIFVAMRFVCVAMLFSASASAQPSDCDTIRPSQDVFTDGTNTLRFNYSRRYESVTLISDDSFSDAMFDRQEASLREQIQDRLRLGTVIRGPSSSEFNTLLVRIAPGACAEDIAPVLAGNVVAGSDETQRAGNPIYDAGDVDHLLVNRLIVQFTKHATADQIDSLIRTHKAEVISRRERGGGLRYILTIPQGMARDALTVANKLNSDEPLVEFAQPDFVVIASDRVQSGMTSLSKPDCIAPVSNVGPDPYFPEQWYLDRSASRLAENSDVHINAKAAWAVTEGDNRIIVAVLDDAVETGHPDIEGKIHSTWNAFDESTDLAIADQDKHGTPVSGIIGAMTGNQHGIKGTAPKVELMPVRVIRWAQGVDGSGDPVWHAEYPYSVVSDGIEKAAESADILSMSLSLGAYDSWYHPVVEAAVDVALAKNRILVFAAGNDNLGTVVFPAQMSLTRPVIAVGATDESDTKKTKSDAGDWGSNFGPAITVVAPGVNIIAPDRTGELGYCAEDYTRFKGTSAATPIVAGVVALMQSQYMSQEATLLTPEELRVRLSETAVDLGPAGRDDLYGDGRVDACAALQDDTCGGSSPP